VALENTKNLVELEMMTWPEVKRAINELGKTTAHRLQRRHGNVVRRT